MNNHQRSALQILSLQTTPKYASWFLQRRAWAGHYLSDEFAQEILMPLCELGFIKQSKIKNRPGYSITQAGIEELETPQETSEPQRTPGWLLSKMEGHYKPERWDSASQRGCHRSIGSAGVMC